MANIGYRTFDGVDDIVELNLGNLASSATVPGTWIFAGRILSIGSDGEIIHAPGFDPLDFYLAAAGPKYQFYNGASDATDGPAVSTTVDAIVVMRQVSGGVARWSIATHNGTVWSSFTHTNSAVTFTNRNFSGSGTVSVGGVPYLNARYALIGHCSTALSDGDIATLTTDLAAWSALGTLTNLWRFDQTPVADLKGTATQSSIVGTTVTGTAFPLDTGGGTSATATPAVVTATAGVLAPTPRVSRTATPAVVTATTGVLTPSVATAGNVNVSASAVTAAAGVLAPTPRVSRTATPIAVTATAAVPTPTVGTSTETYVLTDDFPGSSIDLAKWVVYDRIGDLVNNEINGVIPANVRVSGGSLFIDSKFEDITIGDSETAPQLVHYTSGQVAQKAEPFLYGDVRVRAKIPGGIGLWPCIWMLGFEWQDSQPFTANIPGHNWPVDGWCEIDIAEFALNQRDGVNCALHYQTANRGGSGIKALPFDADSRFMVYRLLWEPGSLTWLVDAEDGVGWRTLLTITGTPGSDVPDVPMYLIIHTAIGGIFGGTPDSSTFPQSMEVDYARVIVTDDTEFATTVTPTVVTATAAVMAPSVTASTSRTVTPAVVSATASVQAPTVSISRAASPSVVTAAAGVLAPTAAASSSATATPAVVTAPATTPAPTASTSRTAAPSVVTAAAAALTPSVSAGGSATAAAVVVTATSSVPAPTVATGAAATAVVVTATALVLAPAASTASSATATPTVVTATSSVPTPGVSAGGSATVLAVVVTATASVPTPAIGAGSRVNADVVTAVAVVLAVAVHIIGPILVGRASSSVRVKRPTSSTVAARSTVLSTVRP